MHESLPADLRDWAIREAEAMGLPGPNDYITLLLRLEKQRQDLHGIEERYRRVFCSVDAA